MSKQKNWTKEDIEKIVDERIKIYLPKDSCETDYKQRIDELERELKNSYDNVNIIEEKHKSEIADLNDKFKEKEKKYKEYIKTLEVKVSAYQEFDAVLDIYNKSCDILSKRQETVLKKISLDNPISFIVSIANEKNLRSYYEYIMYEFSNLDLDVINLYNELVEIMCQLNSDYILIENECQLDDALHIGKNRKHEGKIKKVLVKGYKYMVSGIAVKKSFVEV